MIEKQLDELFPEMILNTNSCVRKKCFVVYLRKKWIPAQGSCRALKDWWRHSVQLHEELWRKRFSKLIGRKLSPAQKPIGAVYRAAERVYLKQLPHSVNQAIEIIDKETGIHLKPSPSRAFSEKLGMKCRRCGVVPGTTMEDDKQRQANRHFTTTRCNPFWTRLNKANVPFCPSMQPTLWWGHF